MIGDNIKAARKNKCMTQEELAERLNVVRQTVSKWEKNLSVPDADLLEKLADILNIDANVLLEGEESKHEMPSEEHLNQIIEQLDKINKQEESRMKTHKKIWNIIGIALISILIIYILWYLFGKTMDINENTETIPKGVVGFINDNISII